MDHERKRGPTALLATAGVAPDDFVLDDIPSFVDAAKTRRFEREPDVRTLA